MHFAILNVNGCNGSERQFIRCINDVTTLQMCVVYNVNIYIPVCKSVLDASRMLEYLKTRR